MPPRIIRRAVPKKEKPEEAVTSAGTIPTKKKKDYAKEFRKSFSYLNKPEDISPTMPKRVSSLTSDKISDLMFRISAWRDYTDDLIYEATAEVIAAREEYQYKHDIQMLVVRGSSVKEKEARIHVQQHIKDLRDDMTQKEMFLEMLERKHENYTNNIAIISREISRRSNLS